MTGECRPLTSLRGAAALIVVLYHYSINVQATAQASIPSLVPHGYLAVDLFFMLSGFIMTHRYRDAFRTNGWAAFPDFFVKRVARIVPLNTVVVTLLVSVGLAFGGLPDRPEAGGDIALLWDGLLNLLMLQGFGHNLNLPAWTLLFEFIAYCLLPILLMLLRWRRGAEPLAWFLALGILAGVALAHPPLRLATPDALSALLRCEAEFAIGVLTYRALDRPALRRTLASDAAGVAIVLAAAVFAEIGVDLLTITVFPPLIAAFALNRRVVERIAASRIPHFLGEISFSIYLLHMPLRPIWFGIAGQLCGGVIPARAVELTIAAGMLATIPVAALSYAAIERPGRRVIRRLAAR